MGIELRQLRHFVAVAHTLHFGRAALQLHMSQPPLSQSILALEAQLGHALFARTRKSVQLTPAGAALLPHAERLLGDAQQLPDVVARAAQGASGRLSLSFVSSAAYSLLPPLLQAFRAQCPGVKITLREATSDVQFADLQQGRIDCGLVLGPLPPDERRSRPRTGATAAPTDATGAPTDATGATPPLAYRALQTEPLVLALPALLATQYPARPLPLSHMQGQDLIIFPRAIAPRFYDDILACFGAAGLTPHIAQEAIQMQTIVSLVSANMGIALVPHSVSNLQRTGVEYVALAGQVPLLETGVAWRQENDSPVLRAFLQVLTDQAGTNPPQTGQPVC
jgi:DNA-binding transcriptional LysR family regulator